MSENESKVIEKFKSKHFSILSGICYGISGIFCFIGFDKMLNYTNSDYSYIKNRNAYVGGDAYNYIINGTYATAFFVLAIGFMLAGCLFALIQLVANSQHKLMKQNEQIIRTIRDNARLGAGDVSNDAFDDLPNL